MNKSSRDRLFTMNQNSLTKASLVLTIAINGLLWIIVSHGCSLEERKSREIRGHTVKFDGVEHGFAAAKGPRYCQLCHGPKLEGGQNGEPSCFQCHGLNWNDIDPEASLAPADHTVINGIYHHHPNRNAPLDTCVNCHGAQLQGDAERVSPSCYLCHEKKW